VRQHLVARRKLEVTSAPPCSSPWGTSAHYSRYSQVTLPAQRAVLPPIYCSHLQLFLYFSIDSLRLQSNHILTSSHGTDRTADVIHMGIAVTEWGWLTARPFFGIWLFGVASHAVGTEYRVNWSYKTTDVKGKQLHIKTVTFCPVLLRPTFSAIFSLWYNYVRSSHNALYPARCLQIFPHPL
jgi:hypothetical protein